MDLRNAISAFALRGARRSAIAQALATSAGLAIVALLVAAWIAMPSSEPRYAFDGCWGPRFACGVSWMHAALGLADAIALGAVALLGFVVAPATVAAAVAQERRAGTLDQLRTLPLRPLTLALGLIVGAPVRVYLLAAGPLALHLALATLGAVPLGASLVATMVVAIGTLASVAIGLAVALAPRQEGASGGFVALALAVVLGGAGLLAGGLASSPTGARWGWLHPLGALHAAMSEGGGVWRDLFFSTWEQERFLDGSYVGTLALVPLASGLVALALAALLLRAACRKLARPERPLLTKPSALALFLGVAAGVLLPLLDPESRSRVFEGALVSSVLLVPLGALLLLLASPTAESWALALRRGGGRAAPFSDGAPAHGVGWLMTLGLALLVALVGAGDIAPLREREVGAVVWLLALSLGMPTFVHFLATRYAAEVGRWGFAALTCVFVVVEEVAAIAIADRERNAELVVVQLAGLLLVAVPVVVALRQRALARRLLASSTATAV